ncbi:MAG: SipW-dependent-type signal peptide-containing protein, partial [Intestinibacillus sp.]
MKKKIVLISAVALLLAVVGYGTYAALNASATAKNVITMGTVQISLRDEKLSAEAAQEIQSRGDSETVWETFPESLVDIQPGSIINKRVFVKNEGESDCYVRVRLNMTITPKAASDEEITPAVSTGAAIDPADVKFSYE